MEPNVIFGLLDIVSGVLIIGISIPLVKRKIKMNRFYGFRIRKAFESDEIWYDLNAYGGKLGIHLVDTNHRRWDRLFFHSDSR